MEQFKELIGKTLVSAERQSYDESVLLLVADDGAEFKFMHDQDCCESCYIESVVGDLQDLVGSPILVAESVSSDDVPHPRANDEYQPESFTWTFYKFATIKGYVDVRWLGESNGYYGEGVDLFINNEKQYL